MSTSKIQDIFCDTDKTSNHLAGITSRPVKQNRKQHRKCPESKMRVRRNLFGPVDHQNTEQFLQQELDILSDLSNRKWNFDFRTEKPLDGRWLWDPVGPNDSSVPSAYKGTMLYHQDEHQLKREDENDSQRCPNVPVVRSVTTVKESDVLFRDIPNMRKATRSFQSLQTDRRHKKTQVQPDLKGFLTVRKRKLYHHSANKTHLKEVSNSKRPSLIPFCSHTGSAIKTAFICKNKVL